MSITPAAINEIAQTSIDKVLPGAYGSPLGEELEVKPEVLSLVRSQVQALLESSSSFRQIPPVEQTRLANNLVKVAGYSAALMHDQWRCAAKLKQLPVVLESTLVEGEERPMTRPAALQATGRTLADGERTPAADEFHTRATGNIARITGDTLNAIAFPTFVADLLKGTFQAVVDASIQQMEAFGELLSNVAKTVDEFMVDNISDNQARDYLVNRYPQVIRLDTSQGTPALQPTDNADEVPQPDVKRDLNVTEDISNDQESFETILVPAARRQLAQSRQQVLATMVLMGMNRVVVTSGRVKASMGFRIDATDHARAESASEFDFKNETNMKYGWFLSPVSVKSKTTVAYVSSSKKDSESEIDVSANLTGEVDLKFKSETFPLERFADAGVISNIQDNTSNPAANKPITGNTAAN